MKDPVVNDVIAANVEVHTRMAGSYNENEPHYRPENRAKVRSRVEAMRRFGRERLLDLGCGTGFVIDLAKDLFNQIDGVDVTQAMLDRVDRSSGNIRLHNCTAERLPFADATFDVATSYAFLHHLEDYPRVLAEAHRVLKPGGGLYVDLEPNKLFWEAMADLDRERAEARYSDLVEREIDSVLHTDARVQAEFGIEKAVFNSAEYTKSILGGIDPYRFREQGLRLGFSACEIGFEWYLGQGTVLHGQSAAAAETVETYLRRILPLSARCFKYLSFVLVK
jgi:ubiquinone/menaquinone biosynthesis C-methylase UbiE